ncbi:MAG: hypothetical protein BWX90_00186 [bacterium ADurb.Bin132]|nr:MAG: hypothetical protein BWX90_00214 [bacterium ADurb.Bin132]OQB74713.1 MAG: hypothetical protein BWX90_00186 [bacterium ADurb.Bin132]
MQRFKLGKEKIGRLTFNKNMLSWIRLAVVSLYPEPETLGFGAICKN